jgi:hypothetical protein
MTASNATKGTKDPKARRSLIPYFQVASNVTAISGATKKLN